MKKIILLSVLLMSSLASADNKKNPHALGANIDFTPHGTQPGLNFPLDPSINCSDCHAGFNEVDNNNMPQDTWYGSMMANATRDPLFWAALDIANNDIPGIGDFCLRCHTPNGWHKGNVVKTGDVSNPIDDGSNGCRLEGYHNEEDSKLNDYQGVTCHMCHRQEELGPNGEQIRAHNANIWVDDQACDNPDANGFTPCRKGPYLYPDSGIHSPPPHDWEYSDYLQKGEFCGSCHDVSSPEIMQNGELTILNTLIDQTGVDTGVAMPIERTNSEWKNSLFGDLLFRDSFGDEVSSEIPLLTKGESCQQCHMPDSDDSAARACTFGSPRGEDLAVHEFAGGSSWMPQVIKSLYGTDLERSAAYDRTTSYALNMLQNKSASMQVSEVGSTADQLDINVRVVNLTGHKLPTGYHEGRRVWLQVEAKDANGVTFFESGAYDPSTAELTKDGQVKIYEAQHGTWDTVSNTCKITDANGNKVFHFVLNNCIAKDNRIPPLGFTGGNDIELEPVGYTYPNSVENPETLVNYDDTQYQIPITGQVQPLSVTVKLKYQSVTKEYMDFLVNESTSNNFETENQMCDRTLTVGPADQTRAAFMQDLYNDNGKSAPVDMVTSKLTIGGAR